MNDFSFNPATGLSDTSAYPTQPTTEAEARGQFMDLFNQIKTYLNSEVKAILDEATKYPCCKVSHNANQNITNNVDTVLAFNTEDFDTDTMHDIVTNNSRITCKTAGKYLLISNFAFEASSSGLRNAYFRVNSAGRYGEISALPVSGAWHFLSASTVIQLNVGDYVEVMASQNSGVNLSVISASGRSPYFQAIKVG